MAAEYRPHRPLRSDSLSTVGSSILVKVKEEEEEEEEATPKQPIPRYRPSTEAPDSFKAQTQILFEEDIDYLAIQSLQTNLFAQYYLPLDKPWWVAPPAHIAFLGTLVVHPAHTTKARGERNNKKIVSVRAHQYLLDVLRSVGPVNGHFKEAFAFRDRAHRAAGRRRHNSPDNDDDDNSEERDVLTKPLANADSIWERVPDFWTMLGWAFACAESHPERWVHWKLWLELLLEVMERDVEERRALGRERGDVQRKTLRESIIVGYIGDHQIGHIMRVLFAYVDGESHPYKEIWPKETLGAPAATNKRKLEKMAADVDLERDQYGDWDLDEDDESEDDSDGDVDVDAVNHHTAPTKRRRAARRSTRENQTLPLVQSPLLEETIPIRRRLFALISQICFELTENSVIPDHYRETPNFDLGRLYEEYARRIIDLPLDVFPLFVWSHMPVEKSIYVKIARNVLEWLLPRDIEQPLKIDPVTERKEFVSAIMMERCFLPYAANSVVKENAKLAVVLWELFSFLWDHEESEVGPHVKRGKKSGSGPDAVHEEDVKVPPSITDSMRVAIMKGIEVRERKSKMKNESPPGPGGKVDDAWVDRQMAAIERDPYAPANVLRLAHLKFRLMVQKSVEAAPLCVSHVGNGIMLFKNLRPIHWAAFLSWQDME